MNNREISVLIMQSINDFTNLIKVLNQERHKLDDILTDKQFVALGSMMNYDKIELKNLSRDLHVSTSSLCILMNKLVDQGYVYREEDTKDRRNTFYGLTKEGRNMLDIEIEKFLSIIDKRIETLDEGEKSRLFDAVSEANSIMKDFI
ncbi:MarR family winged helix-turn-helix transcriptional regulator [[Clostridium] dakarense]|uniref:MarR family winged helix-turn-helix transcriptional regulator n=1 Tax=Faecalimicrobium dakarense TaxID=1301100 RepID=UPI0004B16E06|nr:MarR family winged helix-turn-helix transcriptional regulator [[Clostridium] dakarense]